MTKLAYPSPPMAVPCARVIRVVWNAASPPPHEFLAAICRDDDGGYSVFALNYPGVVSQGDTVEEAKANIAEAFMAVLESRRKHGEDMEFSLGPVHDSKECERAWISING